MPWKQQGGGGGGPWGSGGGGGGPWGGGGGGQNRPQGPDFEDMIRKSQDRFKRAFPGGMGGPRGAIIAVLLVIAIWLGSGLYRVEPGEQGVELLFGEFVKTTTPGLNYWLPSPIGEVYTPNVELTNQITVGFREGGGIGVRDVARESLMLTGDQNIIDIDFVVQWRIADAAAYLFNIRRPEETVKLAAESSIREVVGQMQLQDVLAARRQEVEIKTKDLLQRILDTYRAGIFVADVKLQTVDPPQPVIDAFNDVQRARQDRERQENEALAYRNDIVPKAKGEAEKMIQDANAYKERLVKEADGEAKRFLSVYEAFKTGKEVTVRRIYLERMQQVLRESEKVIIDKGQGGTGVVPYLPLPEIRKRSEGATK
jgi:membrane protease subunit HflK